MTATIAKYNALIGCLGMTATYDFLLKFIVIGDTNVGKSCLSLRFTQDRYNVQHQATLGVEFASKNIKLDGYVLKIQLWDTAGQQSFKSITRSYYRGSIAALIIYDISKRDSFDNVAKWVQEVRNHSHEKVFVLLVGNKNDLQERREVTYQEGERLASRHGFTFMQTSAKTGDNVEQLFRSTSEKIIRSIESGEFNPDTESNFGVRRGKTRRANISIGGRAQTQPPAASGCNC